MNGLLEHFRRRFSKFQWFDQTKKHDSSPLEIEEAIIAVMKRPERTFVAQVGDTTIIKTTVLEDSEDGDRKYEKTILYVMKGGIRGEFLFTAEQREFI